LIYDSTKGIIFFGTPHGGSDIAELATLLNDLARVTFQSPNTRILKSLEPDSELLDNLRDSFSQMLEDKKFLVHSFFEAKPVTGIRGLDKIVSDASNYLEVKVVVIH
jgi:hypothetical protein